MMFMRKIAAWLLGTAIVFTMFATAHASELTPRVSFTPDRMVKWDASVGAHNPMNAAWHQLVSELRTATQNQTRDLTLLAVQTRMLEVIERAGINYEERPDVWMKPEDFITARTPVDSDDVAVATYVALKALGFEHVELLVIRNSMWPTKPYFAIVRVRTDDGDRYMHMYTQVLLDRLPPNMAPLYGIEDGKIHLYGKIPNRG